MDYLFIKAMCLWCGYSIWSLHALHQAWFGLLGYFGLALAIQFWYGLFLDQLSTRMSLSVILLPVMCLWRTLSFNIFCIDYCNLPIPPSTEVTEFFTSFMQKPGHLVGSARGSDSQSSASGSPASCSASSQNRGTVSDVKDRRRKFLGQKGDHSSTGNSCQERSEAHVPLVRIT